MVIGDVVPASPPGARIVTDPDELVDVFGDEPAAHIYALADLEAPFWPASRWYRRGDAVVGVVGLPEGTGLACYAVSTRDPDGTLALLVDLAPTLPSGLLVTGPVGTGPALRRVRAVIWDGPHLRYVLADRTSVPSPEERVVPLGLDDLAELSELYGIEPGAAFFLPHMLAADSFVGIRERGRLVAAAGTHVLSESRRVAAIGAVYARPSHRGRGLGRAVTAGVVARLTGRVDTIGLNVSVGNTGARRVYETLGFRPILAYEEAELA